MGEGGWLSGKRSALLNMLQGPKGWHWPTAFRELPFEWDMLFLDWQEGKLL